MSAPEVQATGLPNPLAPEDRARADYYALLARLYADAPDAALLQAIAQSSEAAIEMAEQPLTRAWATLGAASAAMDPAAASEEYQELFIGVGQSAVSLHASAYVLHTGRNPLVEVRAALARLGLGRQAGVSRGSSRRTLFLFMGGLDQAMWRLNSRRARERVMSAMRSMGQRRVQPSAKP